MFENTGEHSTLGRGKSERNRMATPHDDKIIIRDSVKGPKKLS